MSGQSPHSLIDRDDSVLIVIDPQPAFLRKLPETEQRRLIGNMCWLIGVANWLRIPLVATAEDIPHLGSVAPDIAQALSLQPPMLPFDKMVFNLAADPAILAAVRDTGRSTAILIGLETDVCVAQSALGLLQAGFRVVATADAIGAPEPAHAAGQSRMRDAGVTIVHTKNLFFEWIRTVDEMRRFRAECTSLPMPEGLRL